VSVVQKFSDFGRFCSQNLETASANCFSVWGTQIPSSNEDAYWRHTTDYRSDQSDNNCEFMTLGISSTRAREMEIWRLGRRCP